MSTYPGSVARSRGLKKIESETRGAMPVMESQGREERLNLSEASGRLGNKVSIDAQGQGCGCFPA
jgi:hypothetical protein